MTCTIILVRHGQTEWNREERFRGRADVPLDETGLAQAEAAGRRIAVDWQPAAVYASPLTRTIQTAEVIARHLSLPVQTHPGLIDIDYGQWQGLTPDEARQRWPMEVEAWYHTPHVARIPGGETLEAVRTRTMEAVLELASRHDGQSIVLVSHTAVNRIIMLAVFGVTSGRFWWLHQDTGAINVFEVERHRFDVISVNDTCHLRASPS